MFIRTEVFRIKWQSFRAQLILSKKQIDEEEFFNYLYSYISIDARYTREIKSRIVTSKAASKKVQPFTANIGGGNCNVLHLEHNFLRC
jgi:hypothetical protein